MKKWAIPFLFVIIMPHLALAKRVDELVRVTKDLYCGKSGGQWELGELHAGRFSRLAPQIEKLQRDIKRASKRKASGTLQKLKLQLALYQKKWKKRSAACSAWTFDFSGAVRIVNGIDAAGDSVVFKLLSDGTLTPLSNKTECLYNSDMFVHDGRYYFDDYGKWCHTGLGVWPYHPENGGLPKPKDWQCALFVVDSRDSSVTCIERYSTTRMIRSDHASFDTEGAFYYVHQTPADEYSLRKYHNGQVETITALDGGYWTTSAICGNGSLFFNDHQPNFLRLVRYNPSLSPTLKYFTGFSRLQGSAVFPDGNLYFVNDTNVSRFLCDADTIDSAPWPAKPSAMGDDLTELNGRYFDLVSDLTNGDSTDIYPVQLYPETKSIIAELNALYPFFSVLHMVPAGDKDALILLVYTSEWTGGPGNPSSSWGVNALVLYYPDSGAASILREYPDGERPAGMQYLGNGLLALGDTAHRRVEILDIESKQWRIVQEGRSFADPSYISLPL